jgi:MoaE-MoaD fusion protein
VLFFGVLKDVVGRAEEVLALDSGARVEDVLTRYAKEFPKLAEMSGSIALARNQRFCLRSDATEDGDEIALLPPVSGGAGTFTHQSLQNGNFFALTRDPIEVRELPARVLRGEDGAVVTFEGVVRNNTKGRPTCFLEYEGYESMALNVMAEIGRDLATTYAIDRIAMVHRLGRMEVGETSVAIAVSAPHRKAAFEACLEAINRLKRLVPIWKKEHFVDGEVWVEGQWDETVAGR